MIIQCKMCGGDIDFIPGAICGACATCGSVSTIPQAEDETKLNRYNRANHFRRQCEFDKALTAREKLLEQDDTDAASRDLYRQQAADIAEIQKGILAISAGEKPYDVFICNKETDENGQRTRKEAAAQHQAYRQMTLVRKQWNGFTGGMKKNAS